MTMQQILAALPGKTISGYKLGPDSVDSRTIYDWVMVTFTDGTSVIFHERGQVGEIMLTMAPE